MAEADIDRRAEDSHAPLRVADRVEPNDRGCSGTAIGEERLMDIVTTKAFREFLLLSALTLLLPATALRAHAANAKPASGHALATFAGGCFWCMQPPFEHLDGVLATTVGFTGGHTPHPTYYEVSNGGTGHAVCTWLAYRLATVASRRATANTLLLDAALEAPH